MTLTMRRAIRREGVWVRAWPETHAQVSVLAALYNAENADVLQMALSRLWAEEVRAKPHLEAALKDTLETQRIKMDARARLKQLGEEGRDE